MYDEYNSYALIDLDALRNNYEKIQARARGKRLILIVKANAYGHGSVRCAQQLAKLGGDYFAVANLAEALVLREGGISAPILVLGYVAEGSITAAIKNDIRMACYSVSFAKAANACAASLGKVARLHIAVNTGMNRIGFSLFGVSELSQMAGELSSVEFEGVFSHFSTADESNLDYSRMQYGIFKQANDILNRNGIKPPLVHIQNSAAIITDFIEGDDITNAVRPGIILYGLAPSELFRSNPLGLLPVMSFYAHIGNIAKLEKGGAVSYGRHFTAKEEMRTAVVTAGYADGYHRALSGLAEVFIGGAGAKLLGNVCMDMMMADISKLSNVKIGDTVELFGTNVPVDVLADLCGTINYELCCSVAARVKRIYINE